LTTAFYGQLLKTGIFVICSHFYACSPSALNRFPLQEINLSSCKGKQEKEEKLNLKTYKIY